LGSSTYRWRNLILAGYGNLGSLQIGGCLPEDTLILTYEGVKRITEVKPGDHVYAYEDGKLVLKKVTALIPQGKKPVYRLVTGCRTIEATANHPFLAVSHNPHRNGNPVCWWKPLAKLKPKDHILVAGKIEGGVPYKLPEIPEPRGSRRPVKIPEYTDEDFMRLVGFFIGDGHVHGGYVHLYEPENGKFREKYINLIERVFGIKPYCEKTRITIGSVKVANLFRALGLDKLRGEKTVPGWVFQLPIEQRLAFIEGYVDADGHRYMRKSVWSKGGGSLHLEFCSSNRLLIEQLRLLCITCGLRVTNIREEIVDRSGLKGLKTSAKCKEYRFYARQPRRGLETNKPYIISSVRSIEYVGEKEVYDLTVEDAHNFVANGIIVHNSEVISSGRILYNVTPRLSSIQNTAGQTVLEFG
jgi:Fe-S cluster assembly protein SufB